MEKLTGKCKDDFLENYKRSETSFNSHTLRYKNKLIINFFKLKGIIITFRKSKLGGCLLYFSNEFEGVGVGWSLLDIQEKSISKANEIYNSKQ